MNSYNFCTYFDHNYLPRAMVMLESLHEHCSEALVYVLCLSEECYEAMQKLNYSFVKLIPLSVLELEDVELLDIKNSRSIVEYYFTLTPCLPYYLLQKYDLDAVTYLDADMLFFSSPKVIFDEDESASVIIAPHRFSKHLESCKKYGTYNVSWLTFKNDERGMECLEWYRKSCLEWCYDRLEDNRFADQKYLDVFPSKFQRVHVINHYGAGLAPWNISGASFSKDQEVFMVDGVPLIFLHAQGYKHIWGPIYGAGIEEYNISFDSKIVKKIYVLYTKKYSVAMKEASYLIDKAQFQSLRAVHVKNRWGIFKKIIRGLKKKTIILDIFIK